MSTSTVTIEYVGLAPESLHKDARAKLEAFVETANRDQKLLGIRVFPNFDAVGEELPSGMVAIYSPDARVDATLLSDDLFQMMAVTKVHPPANTSNWDGDHYFGQRLEAIQSSVNQAPPKDQVVREAIRKPISNKETQPWAPQLGGRNAFAGVYSCVQDGDTRKKEHFFAVRATIPDYVADLKREVSIKQPIYRDLLYGDAWKDRMHFGKNAARRNVCRILANMGEACNVNVLRMKDLHAHLINADCSPPEMAVPDWEHVSHSISAITYNGKPAMAVSYGVVPAGECLVDDHFYVVANPYDGISRFPITNHEDIKAAIGLPMDTGRKATPASLVGSEVPADRLKGVTWETTGPRGSHADLHQEAFRPLGKEFKMAMRDMGWNPENHVERLVPIAIKITNPELE